MACSKISNLHITDLQRGTDDVIHCWIMPPQFLLSICFFGIDASTTAHDDGWTYDSPYIIRLFAFPSRDFNFDG